MQVISILVLMAMFITVSNAGAVDMRVTRKKRDTVDSCAILDEKYKLNKTNMYFGGIPMSINVMSTYRAPSRAMAALLATAIRHSTGYKDVYTVIDNRTMNQLAAEIPPFSAYKIFDDTVIHIHVDADYEEPKLGASLLPNCSLDKHSCSIAGPRLLVMGISPSVNLHVYSVLSNKSSNNSKCSGANTWSFYQNSKTLQECDFQFKYNESTHSECVPIYTMEFSISSSIYIRNFQNALESVQICDFKFNRTELNKLFKDVNTSFIFIDYELGYENTNRHVQIVQLPPQSPIHEPTIAMRVADHFILRRHAPDVEKILSWMRPQPEDLRQVLNTDAAINNIDKAACSWANDNEAQFRTWTHKKETLMFPVILCRNSDSEEYGKLIRNLNEYIEDILKNDIYLFHVLIGNLTVNCINDNVSNEIKRFHGRSDWEELAGVAVPRTVISGDKILQVVFYDIPPPKTTLHHGISTSFGSLQQLTHSVRHFLKKQGWSRVGIISEKSALAENITAELGSKIIIKEETLDGKTIAQAILNLKNANARVFYINAEAKVAKLIICEAINLGLVTDDDEYAWIAREWQPCAECQDRIQVFTVSYWWRGGNEAIIKDFGGNEKVRKLIKERVWNNTWPILAEPITNAVLMMIYRTHRMIQNNPERLHDLHTPEVTKLMEDQLNGNKTVSGVVSELHQRKNMQHNPYVYVTAWRGNVSNLVAIWRVQSDTNEIHETNAIYEPYFGGKRPHDGTSKCITSTSGKEFNPFCHDPIWFSVIAFLMILTAVVWKTRQMIMLKFKRQERETLMRLLSRCEKTAAVLEPHLVDRTDLELYEELGSGHFGRVRFGMLRARNRLPTPIAAKALRKDAAPAEEAEFLREASTLATLSHDHIVRLVGVCADADGPPLLLMEHAFFSDLLKYLRQRRHLVEINERSSRTSEVFVEEKQDSLDPEARHVSPEELTRLAREAAEAVDYLSGKHILHRDIRSANCLVDARRILKLADFGMARSIEVKTRSPLDNPNESDDYKYICCRRGVFPVPWMAPESLERGEFSRASDVWALGVLMLEIATLGARPYGSWNPMQVFRFVRSGGRPPLPRDASYHTCEVTEMCWAEKPADRSTAKEVVDFLNARPTALRGALRPAWPEPTVVSDGSDSGFGDRTTENDWPKGDDLRVSTL